MTELHLTLDNLDAILVFGFNWLDVWYTPGVSQISMTIRDDNDASYGLSNRGNYVAVVSDSTRVLGDGDYTPPGGLGVMEGKSFLMKYLGGIDATALCIDSRDAHGNHSADKIIDFVQPESVRLMAAKSIVCACANPVPEIYPYAAKEAGAYIVATGRGDFPNQVNNSVGFPGIP